jgi:hypothetical protein
MLMGKVTDKKINALDLIARITRDIERDKPTKEVMMEDIKMMNFKVKPVSGDIFSLTKKDIGFVESLWKLGKVEEMVADKLDNLEENEKDIFFNYLDDLQVRTQQEIAVAISQLSKKEQKKMEFLELEIFKEKIGDPARLN